MKRKKFVKQLMAQGLDRNRAEDAALVARVHRRESYEQALVNFKAILEEIKSYCKMFELEFGADMWGRRQP